MTPTPRLKEAEPPFLAKTPRRAWRDGWCGHEGSLWCRTFPAARTLAHITSVALGRPPEELEKARKGEGQRGLWPSLMETSWELPELLASSLPGPGPVLSLQGDPSPSRMQSHPAPGLPHHSSPSLPPGAAVLWVRPSRDCALLHPLRSCFTPPADVMLAPSLCPRRVQTSPLYSPLHARAHLLPRSCQHFPIAFRSRAVAAPEFSQGLGFGSSGPHTPAVSPAKPEGSPLNRTFFSPRKMTASWQTRVAEESSGPFYPGLSLRPRLLP